MTEERKLTPRPTGAPLVRRRVAIAALTTVAAVQACGSDDVESPQPGPQTFQTGVGAMAPQPGDGGMGAIGPQPGPGGGEAGGFGGAGGSGGSGGSGGTGGTGGTGGSGGSGGSGGT